MAKQRGDFFIEGTINDLTFYKIEGSYYVRMKSSLSRERFWKDRAFEGSRRSCSRFGEGNQLASRVYKMAEQEKKSYSLFCFLKRRAILLLKEGKNLEQISQLLVESLTSFGFISKRAKEAKVNTVDARVKLNRSIRLVPLKPEATTCAKRIILATETSVQPAAAASYEQAYDHYG